MSHTICIAATCENRGKPVSILCSDTLIEIPGLAKGKIRDKTSYIRQDCSVMLAGNVPKAQELTGRYMKHINSPDFSPDVYGLEDALREPLRIQQKIDIEDYVSSQRGIGYADYLGLPDADKQSLKANMDVHPLWSPCHLILIWSSGPRGPRLFNVSDCVVEQEDFSCIGVGADVAVASLMRRNYSGTMNLDEAIYCVYEAKRSSEVVPGIGPETLMYVGEYYDADSRLEITPAHDQLKTLEKQYTAFGPKPFNRKRVPALYGLPSLPGWGHPNYPISPTKS